MNNHFGHGGAGSNQLNAGSNGYMRGGIGSRKPYRSGVLAIVYGVIAVLTVSAGSLAYLWAVSLLG